MTELGSATVQVWARRKAERIARRLEEFDRSDAKAALWLQQNPPPPKPWLRDVIRKWWKGERVEEPS